METNSGLRYAGEIVRETEDTIVVRNRDGIETPIPRDMIANVTYTLSVEEDFEARLADLEENDANGHYAAVSWLVFDREAYAFARQQLAEMTEKFPDDTRFAALLRIATEREKLAGASEQQEARPTTRSGERAPAADRRPATSGRASSPIVALMDQRIDDDSINMIRVYEIDLNERPTVTFPRTIWDEIFAAYGHKEEMPRSRTERNRIRSADGFEQLRLLFELRAREYYNYGRVRQDPPFMRTFASQIHRQYVLNYCGTNDCHGGATGGDFWLYNREATNPRTVYSNYAILHRYTGERANMLEPDPQLSNRSLLLQYGLKREDAQYPHPEAPGWRPFARFAAQGTSSSEYTTIRSWMESMIIPPREGYPIEWTAPSIREAQAVMEVTEPGAETPEPAESPIAPQEPEAPAQE